MMKTTPLSTNQSSASGKPAKEPEQFHVPGHSLLEGFTRLSNTAESVNLNQLAERDLIYLRTLNSEYRIVLLDPVTRRAIVHGGNLFAEATEATINGASCGGAMLRLGWIVTGLQLEMVYHLAHDQTQNVITSPVRLVCLERASL